MRQKREYVTWLHTKAASSAMVPATLPPAKTLMVPPVGPPNEEVTKGGRVRIKGAPNPSDVRGTIAMALGCCVAAGLLIWLVGCAGLTPEHQAALVRAQVVTCAVVDELSRDAESNASDKLESARRACRIASIAAAVAVPPNAEPDDGS